MVAAEVIEGRHRCPVAVKHEGVVLSVSVSSLRGKGEDDGVVETCRVKRTVLRVGETPKELCDLIDARPAVSLVLVQ